MSVGRVYLSPLPIRGRVREEENCRQFYSKVNFGINVGKRQASCLIDRPLPSKLIASESISGTPPGENGGEHVHQIATSCLTRLPKRTFAPSCMPVLLTKDTSLIMATVRSRCGHYIFVLFMVALCNRADHYIFAL